VANSIRPRTIRRTGMLPVASTPAAIPWGNASIRIALVLRDLLIGFTHPIVAGGSARSS
jgi:hypothetical protein